MISMSRLHSDGKVEYPYGLLIQSKTRLHRNLLTDGTYIASNSTNLAVGQDPYGPGHIAMRFLRTEWVERCYS